MIPRHKRMSRALWRAILLALLGALAPATASASLPSWRDSRLLDAELRRETPLPASSEIKAAAPHVHGVFCPHALPKTRVRGLELGLHCSIGGEAGLTCTSRPAYALRYGGHASERSVFTGYLWDKETNLFFAKARFYDPEVGRFISQDSYLGQVDDPPSLHRYFYGNANPTRYVDPTGHIAILKDLQDKLENAKQGLIDATADFSSFIVQKTGIKSRLIDQKLAEVTGTFAGLAGVASDVIGAVNLGANVVAMDKAPGSRLGLEAGEELAQTVESLKNTATVVVENPKGVALQIVDSQKKKALAAIAGDPAAMADLAATGVQIAADVAIGSKGVKSALSGPRRLLSLADDAAEGAADLAKTSARILDKIEDVADAAPSRGASSAARAERLAGSKLEHMNAAVGEIHGYENMLGRGYQGIRGPGKTTARGADSIAFDPTAREIVVQDAKYRGPAGTYPTKISAEKLRRWGPDIRRGIEDLPDGPLKDAARRAFEEGKIRPEVFRWPQ